MGVGGWRLSGWLRRLAGVAIWVPRHRAGVRQDDGYVEDVGVSLTSVCRWRRIG